MGWANQIKSGGGKYLKVKDGDEVRFTVFHAPYTMQKTWDDGSTSNRFVFSVYNLDEKAPQIYECAPGVASSIGKQLEKKGYSGVIMLTREGSGKETKYNVVGLGTPDAATAAAVEAEGPEPFDLESEVPGCKPMITTTENRAPSAAADDDVPF
jgi:hypothetical protein